MFKLPQAKYFVDMNDDYSHAKFPVYINNDSRQKNIIQIELQYNITQ